ncbi:MAG: alpha-L-rhamnosidase C-terminal domain-containing protein [Victivallaceae bacterium]
MDRVKMPELIRGEWIWKKSLLGRADSFMFARKEFTVDCTGIEADFWISAHCSYQLFINGRFVGFGPRANNNPNSSYVDQYNVSYYLQSGANVISVLIYYTVPMLCRREIKTPGVWCQLNMEQEPLVWSDKSWDVHEGKCFNYRRARVSPALGMTEFVNLKEYPVGWDDISYALPSGWNKADSTVPVKEFGASLEPSPLLPNSLEENESFKLLHKGSFKSNCACTHISFEEVFQGMEGVYAATSFIFSDDDVMMPVKIYSDDPFKFFCNNRLVKADLGCGTVECSDNNAEIPVKKGWNRFLIIQNTSINSIGMMLVFPKIKQNDLQLFQDTIQDAPLCWNIAGPLKLPLPEATPSLKFERLRSTSYLPSENNILDVNSYLQTCCFKQSADNIDLSVGAEEYLLFKLSSLKYGFPYVEFDAQEDDLIDFTFGHRLNGNGFPVMERGIKGTHTVIAREGGNSYIKFKPAECFYLLVTVRKAQSKVKINQLTFDEMLRSQRNETSFRCSDEELNHIWNVGKKVLKRSSAFIYQDEPYADYSCYLFDSYISGINMISAYGDYFLSETRLRQFASTQFENGDIPALSFGKAFKSQINQMFFFPVWLNYQYKSSGNDALLTEMLPHLDMTFEFFESLLDDETGLLRDVNLHFDLKCVLNKSADRHEGISTELNSLYCRYLLSAGEIYRSAKRPETLAKCFRMASDIAQKIKIFNLAPDGKLFAKYSEHGVQAADKDPLSNILALYSGVAPITSFESIFYEFFNFDKPFARFPELTDNPYFTFLFLETLFALDQCKWAIKYLKDYWGRRIDADAVAWKVSPGSEDVAITEFVNGNSIVPNVFLIREVAGVRVAEPGYSTIYFNPAVSVLDWAEVMIPTNYGKIKVRWEIVEDGSLDVTIDAKFPLKVLPEMTPEMIKNTTFRLGGNVSLLDPESAG